MPKDTNEYLKVRKYNNHFYYSIYAYSKSTQKQLYTANNTQAQKIAYRDYFKAIMKVIHNVIPKSKLSEFSNTANFINNNTNYINSNSVNNDHKNTRNTLKSLEKTLLNYSKNLDEIELQIDTVYRNMNAGKRALITPLFGTASYYIEKWKNETYIPNPSHQDKLKVETERGEFVRTKSEAFIANFLYSLRDYIDYKYERPLQIIVNGKPETIYPDFTIINLKTGKVYILEHVGRLDLPEYRSSFVWKHNAYIENGLVQNHRIIYTFEVDDEPLNQKRMKQLIRDTVLGR